MPASVSPATPKLVKKNDVEEKEEDDSDVCLKSCKKM